MRYIFFFIFCLIPLIQGQEKNIHLYHEATSTKVPFTAYGIADVPGNYEEYHTAYINSTKELEDDHFSKKIVVENTAEKATYLLVFRHWFIGELFQLQEEHKKLKQAKWPIISMNSDYPGVPQADLWWVRKQLLPKTKSYWVGDRFKQLDIQIAFIDLGLNRTRIYYHMLIDAEGKRTLKDVEEEVKDGITNIICCKK